MATRKAKGNKAAPKASAKAKAAPKKASAKKAAKVRKSSLDLTRVIKGVPGQDEHFYKKFPRYAAYQMLLKAKGRQMKVGTFLTKIEKLDDVQNRKQAMGIVQKLVDKKRHVGAVCASFV
jgi:hypothetical protein